MQIAPFMRLALRLAQRAYGATSPNPLVGAVVVKGARILGRGWHRRAGGNHAEVEALLDAERRGHSPEGATLVVTLEPCSTWGRTPPCTDAIQAAGIKRVVVGALDPNPRHRGRAFAVLQRAGIDAVPLAHPALADECVRLNEAFNHWIVRRTPFVTVKAAMTLDGKIATADGESKWITGRRARAHGMWIRQGADAVLVGINTVLADDPSLTVRPPPAGARSSRRGVRRQDIAVQPADLAARPRRFVLDARARTPLSAKVVSDQFAARTTIVVSRSAPAARIAALRRRVAVWIAPARHGRLDLRWLLKKLGRENVTSLLVEGGGEVNASFLLAGLAQRIAFFYAPKILGGGNARKAVSGGGARRLAEAVRLRDLEWRRVGPDLLLAARVDEG